MHQLIITDFENIVKKFPEKFAIEEKENKISYDQLNRRANVIADQLKKQGIIKEQIVGTMLLPDTNLVASVLAIFKAGGIYLPLDTAFSDKRLKQAFEQTQCKLMVVAQELFKPLVSRLQELEIQVDTFIVLNNIGIPTLYFSNAGQYVPSDQEPEFRDQNPPVAGEWDDASYIFYTSGSTGEGKPILGAHKSLYHYIKWETGEFKIDENCRISQLSQHTFDASLRDIFLPLLNGGTLCIPPASVRENTGALLQWIWDFEISLIHCVPSLFRMMSKELALGGLVHEELQRKFKALKHILMAGEPLYARDVHNWVNKVGNQVELVNLYGTSETTLTKTLHRISTVSDDPTQILHVGKPMTDALVIITSGSELCKPGQVGEIYISTPYMSKGYYNNQELTDEVFVQNPLMANKKNIIHKTGDLGRYLPDMSVEVLGRTDSQVKVNGIRVELNEVKQAMLGVPGVEDSEVMAYRNHDNFNELVAYYTGEEIPEGVLRETLLHDLNSNILPAYYVHMEEFPLTINGKIDKRKLPQPEAFIIDEATYEPVLEGMEEQLESIWKEILRLKKIGRKAVFFKIGGTSIKAIQMISRIAREMDISLKVSEIFGNPTIEKLAAFIKSASHQPLKEISPIPLREYYDVSHAQKRLWILDQLEQSQHVYNMTSAYSLQGDLDRRALDLAYQKLISRHEILRTTFRTVDGIPWQYVSDIERSGLLIEVRDFSDNKNGINKAIAEEGKRSFNLAEGPLIRAILFKTGEHSHIFVLTMHHIISDGWSMEVMLHEIITCYNAFLQDKNPLLPELRIQYKDYAAWQNTMLTADAGIHRQFWINEFKDGVPVLELPTDFPRPAIKTYNGAKVHGVLPAELTRQLHAFNQKQGVSSFVSLMAAVNALLYRYTGQTDIVLGSPIAGRDHADLEDQIGFYVNTLALRNTWDESVNFKALVESTKTKVYEAYNHQLYPFDVLVDELDLSREMSRSPLFDVMVVLQNINLHSVSRKSMKKLKVDEWPIPGETSKFDLNFNFSDNDQELNLNLEYNKDLFSESTARQIVQHFISILQAAIQEDDKPVLALDYLSVQQKNRILRDFNNTETDFPADKTLIDLFEEQVNATPEAIALVNNESGVNYAELNAKANQLGHYLKELDIQKGDLIGMMLDRSEWMVISLLGILKAGAAYVPIDPDYPVQRISYMLEDTRIRTLITSKSITLEKEGFEVCCNTLFIEEEWRLISSYAKASPERDDSPEDLAYVIYTSGSTGKPKGVMIPNKGVVNRIWWMKKQYNVGANDAILQKTPYVFDVSVWEFFMTLCFGARLVLCSKNDVYDPEQIIRIIEQQKITNIHFVPGMFSAFLDALKPGDDQRLQSLKHIYCSGEALKLELVKRHHALLSCALHNLYGPTEASVDVSYYKTSIHDSKVPIGKPIDNTQLYVLDAAMNVVPVGVPGELHIAGTGLATGYWNKKTLTAQKFVENPYGKGKLYKTGDVARWLPDGNLEYLGRNDHQVKVRGFRIELGEVENALLQFKGVENAVVVAREDENKDNYLAAYFTGITTQSIPSLRSFLKERLPEYMVPAYLMSVEVMPLNANGKIDRKALPTARVSLETELTAPEDQLERDLLIIWKAVLNLEAISTTSNFFEIGGHSLKAIRVVQQIQQDLGLKAELRDIFNFPTIKSLAEHLDDAELITFKKINTLAVQEHYAVSHAQKRIWMVNQFKEHKSAYNMPAAFKLKGVLNQQALQHAFATLSARHESLRTVFKEIDGEVRQVIVSPDKAYLNLVSQDFSDISEYESRLKALVDQETRFIFDLENGPLVRVQLVKIAPELHVLICNLHHIISDGWSMEVIMAEVSELYESYDTNQRPKLADLTIQYKDFAAWQNEQFNAENVNTHKNFWKQQYSSVPTLPDLPWDFERPEVLSVKGGSYSFQIEDNLTHRLKEIALVEGATTFSLLWTAYAILIYYYSGKTDLVIGSPVAGRDHPDLENQVGLYLNMVPLRLSFNPDDKFLDVLEQAQQHAIEVFEHQIYPFDSIVEDLDLGGDIRRKPLFEVVIDSLNFNKKQGPVLSNIDIEDFSIAQNASKYDLSLYFAEDEDHINIRLEYSTDLFEKATIERMATKFRELLKAVADRPKAGMAELCMDVKPQLGGVVRASRNEVTF